MNKNISQVCKLLGIGLYEYGENAEVIKEAGLGALLSAKGFATENSNGIPMIFFDDSQSIQEIRYTIAHELGHILQGHFREGRATGKNLGDPVLEREADSTAAVLMDLIYGANQVTVKQEEQST